MTTKQKEAARKNIKKAAAAAKKKRTVAHLPKATHGPQQRGGPKRQPKSGSKVKAS
jgi:hypothetical protein